MTGVERPSWFVLHDRLDHPYAVVRKTPPGEGGLLAPPGAARE
ncbi:hypothetical protein [Lentzea flaviverrucosa]|nr:hypothetical protein [Lentzea flaviverrucosa]